MSSDVPDSLDLTNLQVWGLDLSYFTGKIEAYLRVKQIPYVLREMDYRRFLAIGRKTGFRQMPQLELADGSWLTDTPFIVDRIEESHKERSITPDDRVLRFLAHLLEDYGDEHLWRPALYYRWAFANDAQLMSARIARGMLRDIPLPFFLRQHYIRRRQTIVFLDQDGVNSRTAKSVADHYLETLAAVETILAQRPFLLGEQPSRADFGFMGSMFRHFFCDPTPGAIMRAQAPLTHEWVARMWAGARDAFDPAAKTDQSTLAPSKSPLTLPASLCQRILGEFLPYLIANADAYARHAPKVHWQSGDVAFVTPVNPYRVWRWNRLLELFGRLSVAEQIAVGAVMSGGDVGASSQENALGASALRLLRSPKPARLPSLSAPASRDRQWR